MEITPLGGHLGARVTGIDLRTATDADIEMIRTAIADHLVLVFPGQGAMTDDEQVAFTLNFGGPYIHPIGRMGGATFGAGHIVDDRERPPYQDKWHTDVSWDPEPPVFGTLRMIELPERGGDTVFASQYAAYDALSEPMRVMLDSLTAAHSLGSEQSFRSKAGDDLVDRVLREFGDTTHPVVAVHPVTGRRHLNVNAEFTSHIVGMSTLESRSLLEMLAVHCANPNFQLRHTWTVGDLVMWDERPTLHFAVADYWPARREIVRVNVR